MSLLFEGVSAAVTTPFINDAVDYENFERHLVFLKENNIQAFVINGTTGESSTLTAEEKAETLKIALKVADGDIPVIAGTGTNSTKTTIEESLAAQELGVDGLLVITPYYNRTTQEGALQHFTAVADAVELPIILYDVPARTGMTITADTVAELSKHPNIVGLKDATGDLANLTRMLNLVEDEFAFYSGNDDIALPFYGAGGHGLISVVANALPKEHQELYELAQTDHQAVVTLNNKLFPFSDTIGEDLNPLSIKAVTNYLGYGAYEFRLPLFPLAEDRVKEIIAVYDAVKEGLNA